MYPGVPLVSVEFWGLYMRAIPKSVIRIYPLLSSTRFSGLMSLWMIFFWCRHSSPRMMQAMKNSNYFGYLLAYSSEKSRVPI